MHDHPIAPVVITLWAPDPEQLAPFYSDILGLERRDIHGHMPNFTIGNMRLVLMRGTPAHIQDSQRNPWPIFAYEVPNYAEIEARIVAAGMPILERSPDGDHSRWFMFPDPAGNILELVDAIAFTDRPG